MKGEWFIPVRMSLDEVDSTEIFPFITIKFINKGF